jgi:hypothetical protein
MPKKTKTCKNCEELQARIAELSNPKPKPFTLELKEDKDGNVVRPNNYDKAVIAGLIEEGKSRTWDSRKAFNEAFNASLANPKVASRLIELYCEKGWDLNDLKKARDEARAKQKEMYEAYKAQKAEADNKDLTYKACKKVGFTNEQFKELLAELKK